MRPAKVLFISGGCLVVAGLGWAIALLVLYLLAQQPLARVATEPGWMFRTEPIELDPGESGRVGVELTVTSHYSARAFSPRGEGAEVDLYQVPIHYRVLNSQGETLLAQWVVLDANRNHLLRQEQRPKLELVGQRLRAKFDPFRVPADGNVQVEMRVHTDDAYGAELMDAQLQVFRHQPAAATKLPTALLTGGVGMLLLIGAVLLEAWAGIRRLRPRSTAAPAARPALAG